MVFASLLTMQFGLFALLITITTVCLVSATDEEAHKAAQRFHRSFRALESSLAQANGYKDGKKTGVLLASKAEFKERTKEHNKHIQRISKESQKAFAEELKRSNRPHDLIRSMKSANSKHLAGGGEVYEAAHGHIKRREADIKGGGTFDLVHDNEHERSSDEKLARYNVERARYEGRLKAANSYQASGKNRLH